MFHVLIAEDDRHTRCLLQTILKHAGYQTYLACDGTEALAIMDEHHIDLIVLDIMMPNMSGYELTSQLRECKCTIPILMLTARQLPQDKRKGFMVGTDDYLTKPFDDEELLLRIKALLRRAQIVNDHKLVIGQVTLDYDALTVTRGTETQTLPQKEFYLLYKLLSYPEKIFTRLQLMDEIWGMTSETTDNTVNVHIHRLRKRFDQYPEFEIVTIRGLGYKVVRKA